MNKKGNIFVWILVFVVSSLIVSAIIDPSIIGRIGDNFGIGQSNKVKIETTDPLVQECINSIQECMEIVKLKRADFRYEIIKLERFEDKNGTKEFLKIWGHQNQGYLVEPEINRGDIQFPAVFFGLRTPASYEPYTAFACDKNGELTKSAKDWYSC
jgi:hypothetical protein